jgi:hypothetical protein
VAWLLLRLAVPVFWALAWPAHRRWDILLWAVILLELETAAPAGLVRIKLGSHAWQLEYLGTGTKCVTNAWRPIQFLRLSYVIHGYSNISWIGVLPQNQAKITSVTSCLLSQLSDLSPRAHKLDKYDNN